MRYLVVLARAIDIVNSFVGRAVAWLVLAAVLVSAGNALVRYALGVSSNAWLEIQWYLFSAIFLLCAGYTLLRNEHVRIDVLLHRLPKRQQIGVDIFGFLVFLLPAAILIAALGWPQFTISLASNEMSSNAGGLIRWPVKLLLPLGFGLLALQGISELIKRVAFLKGLIDDPTKKKQVKSAEEELAEVIRAEADRK